MAKQFYLVVPNISRRISCMARYHCLNCLYSHFLSPPLILLTNIYAGLTDIERNKKGEFFKQIVIIILKLHINHVLGFVLENYFPSLYIFS